MLVKIEYCTVWAVKEILVYTAVLLPSRLVATFASFKETAKNILKICCYLWLISWFRDFYEEAWCLFSQSTNFRRVSTTQDFVWCLCIMNAEWLITLLWYLICMRTSVRQQPRFAWIDFVWTCHLVLLFANSPLLSSLLVLSVILLQISIVTPIQGTRNYCSAFYVCISFWAGMSYFSVFILLCEISNWLWSRQHMDWGG